MSYSQWYKENTAHYDVDFCEWIDKVEQIVEEQTIVSFILMPDIGYEKYFYYKYSPEDAAKEIIRIWKEAGEIK